MIERCFFNLLNMSSTNNKVLKELIMVNSESKHQQADQKAQSKVISFFNGLKNLFGFSAILLSFWAALITGFFVGPSIIIMLNIDGYQPETFTIEKLTYIQGDVRGSQKTYDKYWADGTIAGQKEKFTLGEYVKGTIQNQEELDAQLKIGQQLPVYYNPEVHKNHNVRILYPDENFYETRKEKRKQFIVQGYLPMIVAMLACLFFGILARNIKSAIGFCFGTLFMVGFVWIFTLFKWIF